LERGGRRGSDTRIVARHETTGVGRVMGHLVNAELVANVLKVVARTGDKVGPDDTLVLLESMKMEIPVPAEVSGTVIEVAVSEGDVVTEGDLLAEIQPD
jgi:acetyl-CoA carboxylase biotin carboxyl carrier protein